MNGQLGHLVPSPAEEVRKREQETAIRTSVLEVIMKLDSVTCRDVPQRSQIKEIVVVRKDLTTATLPTVMLKQKDAN